MKILNLFLLILCLTLSVQSCGQKVKKIDKIKALKLKKEIAKNYPKGISIQGFSVDKDGIIRPDKDYEIVILHKTKQFLIKPIGVEYKMADNVEVKELPDGSTMVCHCGFGAGDNCQINVSNEGGDEHHRCQGSCDCGSFYIDIIFHVAQYETMEGNWNSF